MTQKDMQLRELGRFKGVTPGQVGVVVPTYGGMEDVASMLRPLIGGSVAPQERPAKVVVVDDCFPGEVDYSVLPEGVTLVRREVNGGFGAAVNTGIEELGSLDYALVLNSDLRVPEGFLSDLLSAAAPWLPAVVGCKNVSENGGSGFAARHFPTVSHQVVEWLVPLASQRHRALLHEWVGHNVTAERAKNVVPVDWVSGAMMLLPVKAVREIGGFDESYFMYTEEVDLQKRLRDVGIPTVYVPSVSVVHAGGGSSGGEERRRGWLVDARSLYARKHLNPIALHVGLYAATGINFLWNTGRKVAGRDVNPRDVARFEIGLIRHAQRFARNGGYRPLPDVRKR